MCDCSWFACSLFQQLDPPEEEQLSTALQSVEVELGKLGEIPWLYHILQPNDEEVGIQPTNKKDTEAHFFLVTISDISPATVFAHLQCDMSPGNGRAE